MTKAIVITSGKGGVGKTNISVNIAVELARRQYRTCLFDADLGLANVNLLFGLHPEKTIDDLLFEDAPLEQILIKTDLGVDIVPGSSGVEQIANLDSAQLGSLVERFAAFSGYDFFLIDTASGISRGVISFCLSAKETILVLTAEATSLADAYSVLKVLSLNNYQGTVKVLVNRCSSIPQAKKTYLHFKAVADKHLKIDVAPGGAVLFDPLLAKAVSLQYPAVALYPESVFSQCIRALVSNLVRTEEGPEQSDNDGFWTRYAHFVSSSLILPGEDRPTPRKGSVAEAGSGDKSLASQATATAENEESSEKHDVAVGECEPCGGLLTVGRIPGPAPIYSHLLELESYGELTVDEMQRIISHDPALLGRLLEAYHCVRLPKEEGAFHVEHIFQELGEETVRRFLVTTATDNLLQAEVVEDFMATNELWAHSCRCGLMSEALARLIDYPFPEEAYIAGLLHDIGRMALQSRFSKMYSDCPPHAHTEEAFLAEREVVGMTHAELGAEILAGWGLNSFIVDAARYHAETSERIATALDMTRLVCLAHMLCSPLEEKVTKAVEEAREIFKLSAAQVFISMQTVSQDLLRLATTYSIPRRQDADIEGACQKLRQYRRQAVEFTTLQGWLPAPSQSGNLGEEVRAICRGLHLLFGLSRVICLFPDQRHRQLRAEGYPLCYGHDFIENVSFMTASSESRIVDAYHNVRFSVLSASALRAMADKQLLRLMDAEMLLCVPMHSGGAGCGIIVCAIHAKDCEHYQLLRKKLEMFAARAVARLAFC
ncbi:HDOD domain-containing protein [Desulfopila aestuarii]|uniref:HDIG domain-containing protein n=1 Tax=Desulfopila aestuarii DSM 18488 TaxID=1121416 RepID=A0A1M7Y5F0_9BACT|nr:HDOD domain-containing protein [Desulfopila aestuarii]SHO47751.1 HDIG domain-containing protein [Desulfopila aestuarii DSM 18488]